MSTRVWVADLHLGHQKVAALRGFPDTEAHDAAVLEPLLQLTSRDTVWVLGDISNGSASAERYALSRLGEIQAGLHLIAGNHDSVSSVHRRGYRKQREWLKVFDSVQQFGRVTLDGVDVLMSHYPYARSGDGPGRSDARDLAFRLPDVGMPLIHGHTHQQTPHMTGDVSQFCVSWDAHRGIVPEAQLVDWVHTHQCE